MDAHTRPCCKHMGINFIRELRAFYVVECIDLTQVSTIGYVNLVERHEHTEGSGLILHRKIFWEIRLFIPVKRGEHLAMHNTRSEMIGYRKKNGLWRSFRGIVNK